MNDINRVMIESACQIAQTIEARALLMYADAADNLSLSLDGSQGYELILITKDNKLPEKFKGRCTTIQVPNLTLTRVGQIKIAIVKGISTGLFKKGDKIVCLSGVPRFGYVDSLFVIDVGKEFEFLITEYFTDVTEEVYPEVFSAVLNLALELAAQGREGRKVGTIFVIGDHDRVLQLSRQMIMNPFHGYTEMERNIVNPELKGTIKEFAALDGAFIIKNDGTIITAGRHLSAALDSKDFPQGLGSRHIAAAGITSVTKATAIVLSESSGNVSIFKNGKIVVSIEKPTE